MTEFNYNGQIQLARLVWWNELIRDEHGNDVPVAFNTKLVAATHFLMEDCH